MDSPTQPRRKSSTGDADDLKTKGHRKTFVVGGNAKVHSRVPSYGKKLNQLGKLTALSTTEVKAGQDSGPVGSPRRAPVHRSMSQKSLSEVKVRRSSSSQNVPKMKRSSSHHGSTTRMSSLKPMTKVGPENGAKSGTKPAATTSHNSKGKKATFVIDDEEEEEEDLEEEDVVEDETIQPERMGGDNTNAKASIPPDGSEAKVRKENESSIMDSLDTLSIQDSEQQARDVSISPTTIRASNDYKQNGIVSSTGAEASSDQMNGQHSLAKHTTGTPVGGLLYKTGGKLVDPQLSTEFVTSKDIQAQIRPLTTRSVTNLTAHSTPSNSQPLTSRFLESPRKSSMQYPTQASLGNTPKDLVDGSSSVRSPAAPRQTPGISLHSPHGSTTNLGIGASRTQQKLLLQRASSIHYKDSAESAPGEGNSKNPVHPRAQKEIERISRELKNVKRFRNPLKESTLRMYAKGLAKPNVQGLRRTMTSMALVTPNGEVKTPKASQSFANLRQQAIVNRPSAINHSAMNQVLLAMWQKDDHAPPG